MALQLSVSRSGASFSENFYGLKRRRRPLFETDRAKAAVPGVLPEERLRDREIWRSLIFLVSRMPAPLTHRRNIGPSGGPAVPAHEGASIL